MNSETFLKRSTPFRCVIMHSNARIDIYMKDNLSYSFYVKVSYIYIRPIFVIVCFRKLLGEGGGILSIECYGASSWRRADM